MSFSLFAFSRELVSSLRWDLRKSLFRGSTMPLESHRYAVIIALACALTPAIESESQKASASKRQPALTDRSGDGTWYNTGLGACGVTTADAQRIAALATRDFDRSTPDG